MPIGVDIFSGAGGLSLGAEMAGVQIRFAVEKDKSAAETYSYNHPNTLMLQDDIHNIKPNDYIGDRNAPLIEDLGYTVNDTILIASDYGVPQHRNRYFMVGSANGIEFEFPEKKNVMYSVEDAIGDLPVLKNGQMEDVMSYRKPLAKAGEYARLMRQGSRKATQNYVSRNAD